MNRRIKKKIQKRSGYKVYKNYRNFCVVRYLKEMLENVDPIDHRIDMYYIVTSDDFKKVDSAFILKDVK